MKRYIKIYSRYLSMALKSKLMYRGDWFIGLFSLLDPTDLLNKAELEGNKSLRLFVNEEKNNLPFNDVWNYLLEKKNIKSGLNIAEELDEYEKNVQMKR